MARNNRNTPQTRPYQHDTETRTNNPPVGLGAGGDIAEMRQTEYYYNPHLQPILRFNSDEIPPPTSQTCRLIAISQQRPLTAEEAQSLSDALHAQPWLEWANKREEGMSFTVEPVALFIHERLSAQAILETAKRNDVQRDFFADPQQKYREAVKFYEHDVPWSNRLILGDSLQVMDSLAHREGLAGQVQMAYIDPPYGINFRSNFQPEVFDMSGGDSDKHLSREVEQIKAYRDTWELGVHSYLSYLRKRFVVTRELLKDSGSIFVQISVKNVHQVRCLLDDVFGADNFVAEIVLRTRSTSTSKYLSTLNDFILWYAKDREQLKFRQLFLEKNPDRNRFSKGELPTGEVVSASAAQHRAQNAELFTTSSLFSTSGGKTESQDFTFRGKTYRPIPSRGWRCSLEGLEKLAKANRVIPLDANLGYKYYFADAPYTEVTNLWSEQLSEINKIYVVQTNTTAVQRCILMSTDPGDIVLDPTCGSGTTAYVAEQWGRRWITIDTSRIAITLARTRLLTATFDYYKLKDEKGGIGGGFTLEQTPHIQLRDIANNVALDAIFEKHEPIIAKQLANVNASLKSVTPALRKQLKLKLQQKRKRDMTEADRRRWDLPETAWEEWEVPFDTEPDWPKALQKAVTAFRKAWKAKMKEVNACIAASAKLEELVDLPEVQKNLMRVSGPFTVESVQPLEESLDVEAVPDEMDKEPANAAAYLERMAKLLRTGGVNFEGGRKDFARFELLLGDALFHAEGQFEDDARDIGVVFGPQHGPVSALLVEECLSAARRQYEVLLFAGFSFEAEAQAIISAEHRRIQTHLAKIAPDVTMGDLLRQTHSDQLFTVIGAPRTEVMGTDDGQFFVKMEGVDTYNPVDNTVESTQADKVAAWFLDTDYDGRTFCPTQSFFPNKKAWRNIARSLRTVIDEESLAAFSGTESLPFSVGKHNRIAVKVIDRRGNELMKIDKLPVSS